MPKYGVHAFLLEGSWNNEIAPRVIAQAAELGFDFVEIPLLRPDEFDSALIGRELSRNRIEGVTSLCVPKELHMPINPKGALQFLKKAADRIADFGGKTLHGCTYCNLGTLTGAPPTAINPDLIGATCLWHPSKYSPKELATRGLEFLKENAAKAGLA